MCSVSNNISKILPGTFQDQDILTYLDLGDNSLSSVNGEMWIGLKSLTTLRITGNILITEPSDGFSNLPKLETITMKFFLNVFSEFAEFSDKKIAITAKGFEPQPPLV